MHTTKKAAITALSIFLGMSAAVPVAGAEKFREINETIVADNVVTDIKVEYSEGTKAAKAEKKTTNKAISISELKVYQDKASDKTAGKLFEKNIAEVITSEDGWTQIKSGDLTGWVESKNLCLGDEAKAIIFSNEVEAEVKNDAEIYKTNAEVPEDTVKQGEKYKVSDVGEYITIQKNDESYFIKEEDVKVDYKLAEGKTDAKIEEERIAAEKKAEEERKKKEEEARIAAEKKAEEERIAAEKKAEEERIAAEQAAAAAVVSYGVDTTGWATGVASAYGGYGDDQIQSNFVSATGEAVTESSMGVAIPMAWGRSDLYGHQILISYGGKTVTAYINDCGGMGNGSRALDLQPGVFRAFGFDNCNGWGLRTVSYKIL